MYEQVKDMNCKIVLASCIPILLLLAYIDLHPPSCSNAHISETVIIYLSPNYIQIPENKTPYPFTVNVSIYRATNVYAYDFKLYYNFTLLNGTSVDEESFLKAAGNTFFNIEDFNDKYNSTHGRIWVYCTLLGSEIGVNGTGTLVTITFQTKLFKGPCVLDLTETMLSDPSPNPISHSVIDGTVYIGTPPQIRVPADYPTIQQAINAATTGTTILVSNGTYFEQLIINKTISLIGQNKSTTIIDANSSSTALLVTAHSVSIKGFTLQNAASYAMHFNHSSFNEICNNVIKNNGYGICLNNSIRNNITSNSILENTLDGIQLTGTGTIANDTVKLNGRYGIYLHFSNAHITGNKIESNKYGIFLSYSGGNILRKNNLLNNTQNFSVDGEQLSDYIQNIDDSNKINTKTICYLINQKDIIVNPDNFPNIGYLGIINSTNIHIANLNFTNNGEGILLAFTKNSTIKNIKIENSSIGIKCVSFQKNNITQVTLKNSSRSIELKNCHNNTIEHNTIIENHYAFYLYNSNNNTIYHNNIVNNTQQVYADNSVNNQWDNGHQGNYWSNFNGTDEDDDGIGDTTHHLDENQTDHYPLIHPYIPDIAVINVTSNSTKTYIGQTISITVAVMNKWYETENFNITIYANSTLIQKLTVTNLTSYSKANLTLYWNTSNSIPCNYTLYAQADILPGETKTNDNTYTDHNIELIIFDVDFNGDGFVNALDLRIAAIHFGQIGSSLYDLDFDNIVDFDDLETIVINYGENIEEG